ALAAAATAVTAKISVQVHRNLEVAKQSNVVVKYHCDEAHETHRRRLKAGASRSETIASLVGLLKEHTTKSQAPVKSLLANQVESAAVEVATTWIDCSTYIDNAPNDLINEIAVLPEVKSIDEPVVMAFAESKSGVQEESAVNEVSGWGVDRIQAPALWAKGIKGDGIVVASIDTGVRYTHEALKSNWRSEYGWFDPYNKTELPNDSSGRGTHAMGIMVGNTQGIGVAPNAKWIACKGCEDDSCQQHMLVQCAQFLFCPHDKDGNNPDCDKAPHVISNNWGGSATFAIKSVIASWRSAGIIPVFANGDNGSKGCGYMDYPAASPEVISVGSIDTRGYVTGSSSLGPSTVGDLKPDISAPGSLIRSAVHSDDDSLWFRSGTSMAAAHVSGAIALYLSANKDATYDHVYTALAKNVDTDTLFPSDKTCGGIPNTQYPNNVYGYGLLNIFKAATAPPPKCTTWVDNFEVSGKDIKAVPKLTADECCDECHNTPNCNAFTFTQDNGGTCWLKAVFGEFRHKYKEGSKSARVLHPINPPTICGTLEENTDYPGNDITSTSQTSADACCGDCKATSGCKLFVWSKHNGGTCWLKHTQGAKVTVVGAKASLFLAGPPSCGAVESNVDFVGQDVANVKADQAVDCCAACQSNQACNAYSWSSGVCYLKGRRAETKMTSGVVSVRVYKCSSLESDVNYVGYDLSAVEADVADCCAICRQTSNCGAFSWGNGVCYLKTSKGGRQTFGGAKSAVVN
ncbi:hypothetical protein B5M09_010754, partial [Aphanomyces astaci]